MKRIVSLVLVASGIIATGQQGLAQESYPTRRVTIMVPSPAGSTTDALARIVAERLQQRWKQTVIVENGRGLNAGGEQAARAAPDGYTLMVAPPLPLTIANLLYRDIGYHADQFVPVSLLAKIPNVLAVRNNFPAKTFAELVAYGKANPGKLTYASQGGGSTAHLSGAQLEVRAGLKMIHVPYKGSAPALNDLMAGHIDMFFDTLTTSVPLAEAHKIRLLAVASPERAAALPDLPTIAESGLPGFRSITWFAMAGPPKMAPALAAQINRDVVEILKQPDVSKRLQNMRLEAMIGSPADAKAFFQEETALWGGVIKEAKVSIN